MDKVTWFEIPADDTDSAAKFYNSVFGWQTSSMGGGSVMALTTDSDEMGAPKEAGAINGDISPRSASEGFDKPLIVVEVQDMEAKMKMVTDAGGTVTLPPNQPEGMDMIWAIITDPEGNNIGVIQNL
jgi:predicted enzyme related to lactoylglutathione lyase